MHTASKYYKDIFAKIIKYMEKQDKINDIIIGGDLN